MVKERVGLMVCGQFEKWSEAAGWQRSQEPTAHACFHFPSLIILEK
jgi:hypothetical protein